MPSASPSFLRRHGAKLVASALITAGIILMLAKGGFQFLPDAHDLARVHWWAYAAYVPTLFATWWFRSVRWRFLLGSVIKVPKRRLFAVSCAGFAAILLMPFRIGELARPYMLRTRPEDVKPGQPVLTMTAATSSIIAERVIDGLYVSIALAIVLLAVPTIHPLPEYVVGLSSLKTTAVRHVAFVVLGLFVTLFIVLGVFYFARAFAHKATMATLGRVAPDLAAKLTGLFEKLADGLHVFRRGRDAFGFFAETTLYWFFNALGMWLFAMGCGIVHADGSMIAFPEAIGLVGFLSCAILIPGPPGMLGVFQAGITAGMTMYFPEAIVKGPGSAYVFLIYVIQFAWSLATGAWGLRHEGGAQKLRGVTRASAAAEPEPSLVPEGTP